MFLSKSELSSLTNKRQSSAQIKVLNTMRIEHKIRPDGSIAVLRAYIEKAFGLTHIDSHAMTKDYEPNWEGIHA
jgi:hypothetical protein